MSGVKGNGSRLFKTKASFGRAPRRFQVMLAGALPALLIVIYSEKGSDGTQSWEKYCTYLNRSSAAVGDKNPTRSRQLGG